VANDSTFRVFLDGRNLETVEVCYKSSVQTKNGRYLDTTAGGTSYAILGWQNEVVNCAIRDQLDKFGHIDYKMWNDPNVELLASVMLAKAPSGVAKVYFSGNSGAEACEAAMKMSFQAHQIMGNLNKKWFISRKQSYHGSTADALALGDRPNLDFYKPMLSPYRAHVSMHHYKKNGFPGESEGDYANRCAEELEKLILKIGPENVAAFVGETIMGGLVEDSDCL
jgi:adenosylmethionine-8-amino-7-oxononanoate aminotransferase